ncbi:hypothetical protein DFH08DRAFT_431751 [Mycena albidolilacea]|uniref:Uncharacterized protein n=1 Tax=Mycena albidolilacea TaxID=1033008 RepID=A0AAD7EEC1_9AGAR|nr:hypothetical protein DFH08DRAFT_431751 [Mycena albidolilacea]
MPAKALKFKTYRIPEGRHYLIIQNPWPFDESVSNARNPQAYINAVVGWISIMIQDLCSVDIHHNDIQIFYQSTHRHLIVEIQSTAVGSVDALLGAHHSSAFLTAQYAGGGNLTSVIYEYNYMRFNSPEKTNWTSHTASYSSLPPDFPVKPRAGQASTWASDRGTSGFHSADSRPSGGSTTACQPVWGSSCRSA